MSEKLHKKTLIPTNVPGLYKNTRTGVIVNTNIGDYQKVVALRKKKKMDEQFKEEFYNLKNDVANLQSSLNDIIKLLKKDI